MEAGTTESKSWSSAGVPGGLLKSVSETPAVKSTTTVELIGVDIKNRNRSRNPRNSRIHQAIGQSSKNLKGTSGGYSVKTRFSPGQVSANSVFRLSSADVPFFYNSAFEVASHEVSMAAVAPRTYSTHPCRATLEKTLRNLQTSRSARPRITRKPPAADRRCVRNRVP